MDDSIKSVIESCWFAESSQTSHIIQKNNNNNNNPNNIIVDQNPKQPINLQNQYGFPLSNTDKIETITIDKLKETIPTISNPFDLDY
jgi:thymidylate synthase